MNSKSKTPSLVVGYTRQGKSGKYITLYVKEDLKKGDKITLFTNSYKNADKDPDFRGIAAQESAAPQKTSTRPAAARSSAPVKETNDDEGGDGFPF